MSVCHLPATVFATILIGSALVLIGDSLYDVNYDGGDCTLEQLLFRKCSEKTRFGRTADG